jgi:hypothetical protein
MHTVNANDSFTSNILHCIQPAHYPRWPRVRSPSVLTLCLHSNKPFSFPTVHFWQWLHNRSVFPLCERFQQPIPIAGYFGVQCKRLYSVKLESAARSIVSQCRTPTYLDPTILWAKMRCQTEDLAEDGREPEAAGNMFRVATR